MFYDLASSEVGNQIGTNHYPFGARSSIAGGAFPLDSATAAPPQIVAPGPTNGTVLYAFDPNLKLPYTLEWNVGTRPGEWASNLPVVRRCRRAEIAADGRCDCTKCRHRASSTRKQRKHLRLQRATTSISAPFVPRATSACFLYVGALDRHRVGRFKCRTLECVCASRCGRFQPCVLRFRCSSCSDGRLDLRYSDSKMEFIRSVSRKRLVHREYRSGEIVSAS